MFAIYYKKFACAFSIMTVVIELFHDSGQPIWASKINNSDQNKPRLSSFLSVVFRIGSILKA